LLELPQKIQSFIEKNIKTSTVISGFDRVVKPQYPLEAMREAIINALAHRDYSEGKRIHIIFSDNKFTVTSPGLPLKPLTLEKIRKYQASPFSRNPKIACALSIMKYMEERGRGLLLMRDQLKENSVIKMDTSWSLSIRMDLKAIHIFVQIQYLIN
jgi:ATP-dependent DNA helicase RecG